MWFVHRRRAHLAVYRVYASALIHKPWMRRALSATVRDVPGCKGGAIVEGSLFEEGLYYKAVRCRTLECLVRFFSVPSKPRQLWKEAQFPPAAS